MKTSNPCKMTNRPLQRKQVLDLNDYTDAARKFSQMNRLINDLIMIFGRRGIFTKGPLGHLQKCSYWMFMARDNTYNLYLSEYPGAPDIYLGFDAPSKKQE